MKWGTYRTRLSITREYYFFYVFSCAHYKQKRVIYGRALYFFDFFYLVISRPNELMRLWMGISILFILAIERTRNVINSVTSSGFLQLTFERRLCPIDGSEANSKSITNLINLMIASILTTQYTITSIQSNLVSTLFITLRVLSMVSINKIEIFI